MIKNRYPGTQPFTAEQKDLFYGRKQETDDLMKLIRFQQMVVLYGKSGLGKSSLLNTKIKQDVETQKIAEVFAVRFNAWTEEGETPLSKTVASLIRSGNFESSPNVNPLAPIADDTLWYAAKTRQLATGRQRFMLVFDQFEELFTYPDAAIQAFKESLAELMRAGLPKRIEENINSLALSDDALDALYETAQAFERTIHTEGSSITAADTPMDKLKAIIDDYYKTQLNHDSITDKHTAHRLIEDELVIETGDGKGVRVTLHELSILVKFARRNEPEADEKQRLKQLLDALVNVHLLRREVGSRGGDTYDTYELSHDKLIGPVLAVKTERKALELKLEKAKKEAEQIEREAKQRLRLFSALALAVFSFSLAAIATWQYFEAKQANRNVVYMLMREADKSILSLNYEGALKQCQTALSLNVAEDSINQRLQEIAYFYTETDTFRLALDVLNLMNIHADPNRSTLRLAIKRVSPQYFDSLEHRYYPEMINVEGGKFKMENSNEVEVNSFKIAKTETTVWQYSIYLKSERKKPYDTPSWQYSGNNPMIYISWYDAVEYANWVSRRKEETEAYNINRLQKDFNNLNNRDNVKWIITTKRSGYSLPNEAEWEFSARGGKNKNDFQYSGDSILTNVAWYSENSISRTHSVGSIKPNALGLFDMSGNVWEWCNDWYSDRLNISSNRYWLSPEKGTYRTMRGGSWSNNRSYCRLSYRLINSANDRSKNVGFRLVEH